MINNTTAWTKQTYSSYTKTTYQSSISVKTNGTEKAEKNNGLSQKAQEYLEKLKSKYKNVDFKVGDLDGRFSRGGGEYQCIITPDLIEQMANDDAVAAKYEGLIDEGTAQLDELKTNVSNFEFANIVEKYGFKINSDGQINYYALLKGGLPQNKPADNTEKPDEGHFKTHNTGKIPLAKGNTIDELFKVIEQASRGQYGSSVEFIENKGKNIFNPNYFFKA